MLRDNRKAIDLKMNMKLNNLVIKLYYFIFRLMALHGCLHTELFSCFLGAGGILESTSGKDSHSLKDCSKLKP